MPEKVKIPRFAGNKWNVITSAAIASALYLLLIAFLFLYTSNSTLRAKLMLAGVVGGVLGWVAGILASPFSTEKDEFTSISKLVYGFVSGWLVNKIDALFASSDAAKGSLNELTWIFIGYIAASFLIAVAMTYIARSYWLGEGQKTAITAASSV